MSAKIECILSITLQDKMSNDVLATNGRRAVLLNVLEGFVGCQHLGKLLPCLWTEVVFVKTAKKEAELQMSAKIENHLVDHPGVKKEMMFWQQMEGGRSYLMF